MDEEVEVVEPGYLRNSYGDIIYVCKSEFCVKGGLEQGHYHGDVPYLVWKNQ